MVVLEGVYAKHGDTLRFHELAAPSSSQMQRLLDAIVVRVLRCLVRDARARTGSADSLRRTATPGLADNLLAQPD